MRTKKSVINMFVGVFVQIEIAIIGVLTRRFFIQNLSIEYLGCNAVFSNILQILSLVCCGASAVSYLAIKAMANESESDIQKVFKIIHIYQWITCILLASIGSIAGLFLPGLLENSTSFSWEFLTIVYLLFLADLCLSNWSGFTGSPGYYDCIIKASQNVAVCSIFNFFVTNVYMVLQCIILVYTKNYLLYLLTSVSIKSVYILLTREYCYRKFPYLRKKVKITWNEIKKTRLLEEIGNNLVVTIAMVIFNGTDNLVITGTLGITVTALYSNYQVLYNQLRSLIGKFINGMSMSIADFIHKVERDDRKKELFYKVQFLCGVTGLLSSTCFFNLAQPFITLFWGEGLLLDIDVVFTISLLLFITVFSSGCAMFRHAMGHYWMDRNYQLLCAISNLFFSIILAGIIGVAGVLIGTIIGNLISIQGYLKVIRNEVIESYKYSEWWKQAVIWFAAIFFSQIISYITIARTSFSFLSIIIRGGFSIVIALIIIGIICIFSPLNRNCAVVYMEKMKLVAIKIKNYTVNEQN